VSRYKNRWGSEERAEYDALVKESWASHKSTFKRVEHFKRGLLDAVQARRLWATEVSEDAHNRGLSNILKGEQKRQRATVVMADGRQVEKPQVIGIRRLSADGSTYTEQTLFDFVSVDELEQKRREYLSNITAYSDNVAVLDKLLALCEAGRSDVPATAAANLRTTVEAWLGRKSA